MDLSFVTTNPGKLREARAILAPFGVRIRPQVRKLPEPQADTLREVVRAKLAALPSRKGYQMVEDSGLFLTGLGGFPGVYSSYIYRTWSFDPILELLESRSREAVFRTVAGLRWGPHTRLFEGACPGRIAPRPRGAKGFGFDPIFVPEGSPRTFGEMSLGEKWKISHRGRALQAVGRFLASRAPKS
jgi:XTP/dITP diphosphohydrolase